MRVKIGPYIDTWTVTRAERWWLERNHPGKNHWEIDEEDYTAWDRRIMKLLDIWQDVLHNTVNRIQNRRQQSIKVHIDRWDTWSMDHTLAHIVLPMLKQLKATKHGSPYVDAEDLPKELRLTKREKLVNENGHWDKKLKATEEEIDAASKKFHAQWDWVMDQMIWSFEQELDEDGGHKHYYDAYEPNEPTEPPMSIGVIDKDGNVTGEKTFSWDTEESRRQRGKLNMEKRKAYEERKQLGFTLFGKYYQALWD